MKWNRKKMDMVITLSKDEANQLAATGKGGIVTLKNLTQEQTDAFYFSSSTKIDTFENMTRIILHDVQKVRWFHPVKLFFYSLLGRVQTFQSKGIIK